MHYYCDKDQSLTNWLINIFQNEIAPGKRPLSSMIPTLVYKTGHACGLRMVLGAANGTKIITGNYGISRGM